MSRQDLVDQPADACPHLHQLLAGYFHQDWPLDRDRWEDVVDEFVRESPHSVVVATADELADVLDTSLTEPEFAVVLERLGASVVPDASGLTSAGWLQALLQRLRSSR